MLLDENIFGKKEPVMIREFRDQESLNEIRQLFDEAAVPYAVFDSESRFDVTFSYDKSRQTFKLFVPEHFAEKATKICETEEAKVMENLPGDYYLFSFTNDELKSVIIHSFEWSPFDVALAKNLLHERGDNPDAEEIIRQEEEALTAQDAPERINSWSLFWGYFFSVLGGIFGIGFVIYILSSKKTKHEGIKISRFDSQSKKHAYYMILVIILSNALFVFYRLNTLSL